MLLSLWYLGKHIRKIIQTGQGYCTNCNISHYCVSKCTRLYLRAYSFQNTSRGEGGGLLAPGPPMEACCLCPLGTSPPKDKSQIDKGLYNSIKKHKSYLDIGKVHSVEVCQHLTDLRGILQHGPGSLGQVVQRGITTQSLCKCTTC